MKFKEKTEKTEKFKTIIGSLSFLLSATAFLARLKLVRHSSEKECLIKSGIVH
jgi:hypothetical protein